MSSQVPELENDTAYLNLHFKETSLIFEASKRLKLSSVVFSTACRIYHAFYDRVINKLIEQFQDGDVLGPTATYLAAKAEEEPVKIRDVVNVCYRILHPDEMPLDIGDKYWILRDSIQYCELFILRVLDFQVSFDSPQKYLLSYLNSLKSWVDSAEWSAANLAQLTWNMLQDSFHLPIFKTVKPEMLSLAVLMVGIRCCNLKILTEGSPHHWWQAFLPEASEKELNKIATRILNIYHFEEMKNAKKMTSYSNTLKDKPGKNLSPESP